MKLLKKNKGLGTWWKKKEFQKLSEDFNYKCYFLEQNNIIHTSHYRMDVLFIKNN